MTEIANDRKRVCVVGLDGVPYPVLRELIDDGIMPNMGKLDSIGNLRSMEVTLPEISSVSWPSFMTGTNPGTHGVYGFTELKPNSYDLRFTNFNDLKAPPFWNKLRDAGKRSVVINLPGTYPVRPIDGALIAGFVAIDFAKAVYPLKVYHELKKFNYEVDVDIMKCREDHAILEEQLTQTLGYRRKAVELLWDGDWDVFNVVVTGTDRLHHFLFPAILDKEHPKHQMAIAYYKDVDGFIGEMMSRFSECSGQSKEGEGFYMLSDHGFCEIKQEVSLNTWLVDNGFLKFDNDDYKQLNQIAPGTKAFAMDPSRTYINRKGKYPQGNVDNADADHIINEIASGLMEIEYNGEKIMRHTFRRDEIYSGPQAVNGPDLVAVSHHGYDLKGSTKKSPLFKTTPQLVGMHNYDEAFFWSLAAQEEEFNITNVAGLILRDLGVS